MTGHALLTWFQLVGRLFPDAVDTTQEALMSRLRYVVLGMALCGLGTAGCAEQPGKKEEKKDDKKVDKNVEIGSEKLEKVEKAEDKKAP